MMNHLRHGVILAVMTATAVSAQQRLLRLDRFTRVRRHVLPPFLRAGRFIPRVRGVENRKRMDNVIHIH